MNGEAFFMTFATTALTLMFCTRGWFMLNTTLSELLYTFDKLVALLYLTDFVLLVHFKMPLPILHECNGIGIFVNLIIIMLAFFNLLNVFAELWTLSETGKDVGAWISHVFGLVVTVTWVYIEYKELFRKLMG